MRLSEICKVTRFPVRSVADTFARHLAPENCCIVLKVLSDNSKSTEKRAKNVPFVLTVTLLQNEVKVYALPFVTHVHTCLATNQVVASCSFTNFQQVKITQESYHTQNLHHLLQNKFSLDH